MRDIEERRPKDSARELKRRKKDLAKRRRQRNREYTFVSWFFVLIFVSLAGYLIYFNSVKSEDFINSPYNTRQDTFSDRVVRGRIESSDGQVLAQTNVYEDGSEERTYPYSNIFAHVVGYDSNGKSGLESEANFSLLSSHAFFVEQMKNEFLDRKNMGDTVISTLNSRLQVTAYNALGNRRGAVVVMEPQTGRILAEVSKPDFDPNTISQNWQYLINDQNDSSLLNRATNGAYPPGSVFKIVTALDYFRTKGTMEGFSYDCTGSTTREDYTLTCYHGAVHGLEDFYSAFANSCNTAFAEIGLDLGAGSLRDTAEGLLFNRKLPLNSYRTSSFSLDRKADAPMVMQTAIGQGATLVSPMHMALITSAVANGGILMKPYLIDEVVNNNGDSVKRSSPEVYRRLMSGNEANLLGKLMKQVVDSGTGYSLSGRSYSVAGKTGSAEFDENGSSHSWFVGYSNVDDPDIAVAVIVENGGAGNEAAVPLASQIFEAYYNG